MQCKKCKHSLEKDSSFCSKCGHKQQRNFASIVIIFLLLSALVVVSFSIGTIYFNHDYDDYYYEYDDSDYYYDDEYDNYYDDELDEYEEYFDEFDDYFEYDDAYDDLDEYDEDLEFDYEDNMEY